ncbi:SpoIIIAH-like family protein [Paenibacillus chungangensis]|uniref:SpoIIIAH-like family protein n=1 Tax=Paenibacillus chungangensis TaxID=696535 RepID=A0ABW3HMM1_9BACL
MNTKRQTIWLVSMLSLMVLLSAYYLFTQDIDDVGKMASDASSGQQAAETAGKGAFTAEGIVVPGGEYSTAMNEADKRVLEQLEREGIAQGGVFSQLLAKRQAMNEEEGNRIWSVVADVSQKPEEATAAFAEWEKLEEKHTRMTTLESKLMEDYEIAVVSPEENDRYKVVVSSDKLEKKEAASIIEQVITVLEVRPEQVSVQYVPAP